MKKVLSLILTFIISLIATAVLVIINMWLWILFYYMPIVPLISSALVAFGTAGLCKKPCGKYGFNGCVFWAVAFIPQFIAGLGALVAASVGWFGGVFDVSMYLMELYFTSMIGLPYGIFGAIFTHRAVNKIREAQH